MIKKKIVGIYVDSDSLHYVSVVKGISGYCLKPLGQRQKSHDIKQGSSGYSLLRGFLIDLPVDNSRAIYLALPRSEVFMREITLPVMPVEDALLSIKNSLAIYSHLDPDEIYYDVIVSDRNGGSFHALLVYAPKDEIDKYRKLFSETGHGEYIKGIFPLSYGVAALIDNDKSDNAIFSLVQGETLEIFARSGHTLIFSISCPADSENDKAMILNAVQNQLLQLKDNSTLKDSQSNDSQFKDGSLKDNQFNDSQLADTDIIIDLSSELTTLGDIGKKRKLTELPPFQENYASAAVAPILINRVQQISLDDGPVKIKIIHPFRYIVLFLFILMFALYFITDNINTHSIEASKELKEIVSQVKELEKELEPLQSKIDTLKKASRFKTDVEEFMQTRPQLYTAINEIATLVPDGTWFANFTFNNSGITLRGTGKDALKTVEALRSSKLFDNVMLRGSVNRRPNGDESFTLALELKIEEIDQAKDDSKEGKEDISRGEKNE
ncbi:MAG: PilN domain-containing protein [Desulfamplus sp.]|nr:PilN domain-containing protein [Desulfamplus sp.]